MKKQEGITLISLVAYIAVAMIVIGVMAVVSSYFYKNIDWVKDREKHAQEFNKFNMFFIGDVKANKDATVSGAQIEFADGTIYRYDKDNGRIPKFYDYSMQYLGRSNPKYVGGFNTYLRWRNLEFSTQWSYKVGHIIPSFNDLQNAPNNWRDAEQAAIGYSSDLSVSGTNRERKYLSFWKTSGDVTDIPRFVTGDDYWAGVQTDAKYEKGNYLRLTNIAISYRLPVEVAQRFGMKNMSLSFNAYNLL